MKIVPLQVDKEYVEGAGVVLGAMGSHDSIKLRITFSDDWNALSKYATFRNSKGYNPKVVVIGNVSKVENTDNTYDVSVPGECMQYQGLMSVAFTGYKIVNGNEEASAFNTATAKMRVLPSDFELADDGSVTATLAQQLQKQIDTIADLGPGVPKGGAGGEVLAKKSDDDFDVEWIKSGNESELYMLDIDGHICPNINGVSNSVSNGVYTRRIKRMLFDDFTWEAEGEHLFKSSSFNGFIVPESKDDKTNVYAYKYITSAESLVEEKVTNNVMAVTSDGKLLICDFSYSSASALKAALKGRYLYYEIKTYETELIDGNELLDSISKFPTVSDEYQAGNTVPRDADTLGGRISAEDVEKSFAPNYARVLYPFTEVSDTNPITYVATENCWVVANFYGYNDKKGFCRIDNVITNMCSSSSTTIVLMRELIPLKKGQTITFYTEYSTLKTNFTIYGC